MKIVVLDGYTTNPGDLSWGRLEELGDCDIFHRTPPELLVKRSKDADIVLTNKTVLNRTFFENADNLKYVGLLSTGYNVVDVVAARDRGIIVCNVPSYGTDSVAQTVFAHLLNITHHVSEHAQTVSGGKWSDSDDFTYQDFPLLELSGKILGIIGFGRIGNRVAKIAQGFGMKVIFYTVPEPDIIPPGTEMCSLHEVFINSDVLSLHCPLNEDSKHIVNENRLKLMKKNAIIINTSRGQLIDEQSLYNALKSGNITGAGLDVLEIEPPLHENPLFELDNCYITPHYSWATRESRARLIEMVVDNVKSFIAGEVKNKVN